MQFSITFLVFHPWNNNLHGNTKMLVLDMAYDGQSGLSCLSPRKASPSLASPSPSIYGDPQRGHLSPAEEAGGQGPDKVRVLIYQPDLTLESL